MSSSSVLLVHGVQLALGSYTMHSSRALSCPTPGQRGTSWSEAEGLDDLVGVTPAPSLGCQNRAILCPVTRPDSGGWHSLHTCGPRRYCMVHTAEA